MAANLKQPLTCPATSTGTLSHESTSSNPATTRNCSASKELDQQPCGDLALVAELVYGEEPSWEDPVKFSFAYGGKDGVPYPVDRKAMDESIEILRQSVEEAKIGEKEKLQSLQRLRRYVPVDANS